MKREHKNMIWWGLLVVVVLCMFLSTNTGCATHRLVVIDGQPVKHEFVRRMATMLNTAETGLVVASQTVADLYRVDRISKENAEQFLALSTRAESLLGLAKRALIEYESAPNQETADRLVLWLTKTQSATQAALVLVASAQREVK